MQQTRLLLLVIWLLFSHFIQPLPAAETPVEQEVAQDTTSAQAQVVEEPSDKEQKDSLISFYTWAGGLPKDLTDLLSTFNTDSYNKLTKRQIPEITADIRDLQWEIATAKVAPYLQKMQLDRFQRELGKLQQQIDNLEQSLTDKVAQLSAKRNEWLSDKEKLNTFSQQDDLTPILTMEKQENLKGTIEQAIQFIDANLKPALQGGNDLALLQSRLQSIKSDLLILDKKIMKSRLRKTSLTVFDPGFYTQINAQLFYDIYENTSKFVASHNVLLHENLRSIALVSSLFILIATIIYLSKNLVPASSRWYPFATCPFATTCIIVAAIYTLFNQRLLSIKFENQWTLIINIITILAVARLVPRCIDVPWKRILFVRLSIYMVVIMLLATLELPQILMLLFVFGASVATFMIYLAHLRTSCHSAPQKFLRNFWGILPAIIIVSCSAGYDQFAIFLFSTAIGSIGVCLIIWMLFHLISGSLELGLKILPFPLVRENIPTIVKSVQPFLAVLHILLVLAILSVTLDLSPSTEAALATIYNSGFDFSGLHISLGFIITFFIVFYGAVLFSRAIQAVLLSEVLPRYNAEKGVQLSITRLVHYGILTIGFLVMLKVLGFQMQQLTILGGALGVGIGFGLQAIVNNFVGGLILLFERPIKVGDTIQVGEELGEVKNLGLRATIIQTFDNSEIVVPNSDLVTGQVTNWTLAERKVRIKIPVGVAYGTDVAKVLEILLNCAEIHPMVLSTPTPAALFLAFGASSLDFELRVWIPEYLDKMTATSELNQSIETEFALNNIEIPFQQTDLHIRSVTDTAAMALTGTLPQEKIFANPGNSAGCSIMQETTPTEQDSNAGQPIPVQMKNS